MATKTIDHMDFYVAIAGYQLPSVPDQTFNSLRVSVGYSKGSGFYASFHPGWGDGSMWGCMLDFSKDPLSAGMTVDVVPAEKNNVKRIAEMTESLKMAKDIIAALFDDREWQKLKGVLQNVARFGYTDAFKEQADKYLAERVSKRYEKAIKPTEREQAQTKFNSSTNENSETMAQNVKAADLIGKEIIMGTTGAKYVVKSVAEDKLICDFENPTQGMSSKNMPVPFANVQKFIADGKWTVADANEAATTDVTTEADVQEVQDIVPVVTPKAASERGQNGTRSDSAEREQARPEVKAKSDGGSKTADVPQTSDIKPQTSAKVEPIKATVKPEPKPKAKSVVGSTYRVELLPTKDGQKWPKLYGFKDESEAKKTAGKMAKTVTYSWDRDEQGEKRYYLKGGKKYCEVFQQLADALNAGNRAAIERACMASVAIFEGARAEGKKKSEGRGKTEDIHQPSAVSPQPSTEKTYTQTELAEWLRKLNAGTDKEKAAAAKFFNDLAKAA